MVPEKAPIFNFGRCVITQGPSLALQEAAQSPQELLRRHLLGDWGLNDLAVEAGERVLSVYTTRKGDPIWVISERGYTLTTILGGTLHGLQYELGDQSITTTEKYGQLGPDERRLYTLKMFADHDM